MSVEMKIEEDRLLVIDVSGKLDKDEYQRLSNANTWIKYNARS